MVKAHHTTLYDWLSRHHKLVLLSAAALLIAGGWLVEPSRSLLMTLAAAILAHAEAAGVAPAPAADWSLEPGLGATALTDRGRVLVGNRALLAAHGIALTPEQEAAVAAREQEGETVALVAAGGEALGVIGITDPVRPEALEVVAALNRAGVRRGRAGFARRPWRKQRSGSSPTQGVEPLAVSPVSPASDRRT